MKYLTVIMIFFLCLRPCLAICQAKDPVPGQIWRDPLLGMEFVWIPPGCFIMGSNKTMRGDHTEYPAHKVCLDGFWMGRFEVTNKQFRAYYPRHDSGKFKGLSLNDDQQPVVNATWRHTRDFARWLSNKSGKRIDLPTEAQWEYAARADTNGAWYFGDKSPCLYENLVDLSYDKLSPETNRVDCDDGYAVSAPVGRYAPNPFGLYDMLGNVAEMCLDAYDVDAYVKHSQKNPAVMDFEQEDRISRGSCYTCAFSDLSLTSRAMIGKDGWPWDTGFRLVRKK